MGESEGPEDASIDPRIADRRDEVQRTHRRQLLRRASVLVVVVLLVVAAVAVTRSPLLDVDHIDVAGVGGPDRAEVLDALSGLVGSPMLDVDAGEIRDEVGALPWVSAVEVGVEWPATVTITVQSRAVVARVEGGSDGWQLVDIDGRVIDEVADPPAEVPVLLDVEPAPGPGARLEGVDELLVIADGLPVELRARIRGLRFGADHDVFAYLVPEGRARLGDADAVADKMAALTALLGQVDDRCLDVIDVRVPSTPTITRVEECAGPTTSTTTIWLSPPDTVPVDAAPTDTAPAYTVPAETVPASTVPAETVPASTVPASTAPTAPTGTGPG